MRSEASDSETLLSSSSEPEAAYATLAGYEANRPFMTNAPPQVAVKSRLEIFLMTSIHNLIGQLPKKYTAGVLGSVIEMLEPCDESRWEENASFRSEDSRCIAPLLLDPSHGK